MARKTIRDLFAESFERRQELESENYALDNYEQCLRDNCLHSEEYTILDGNVLLTYCGICDTLLNHTDLD
jgi:hypothetical protein